MFFIDKILLSWATYLEKCILFHMQLMISCLEFFFWLLLPNLCYTRRKWRELMYTPFSAQCLTYCALEKLHKLQFHSEYQQKNMDLSHYIKYKNIQLEMDTLILWRCESYVHHPICFWCCTRACIDITLAQANSNSCVHLR